MDDDRDLELRPGGQVTLYGGRVRPLHERAIYTATFAPILVLAAVGAALRRHDVRRDAILWSVLATFVATHAIFFPATRYRTPMEFVLIFYAAVAIDVLIGRWSPSAARRVTAAVA
jgi:hypothetical protein